MKRRKIIFAIMTLLWVMVIFWFSMQPGDVSGNMSGSFLATIMHCFALTIPAEELELWHTILRKCAHFSEFAILGILSGLTLLQTKVSLRWLTAMGFCLAVAVADETLQLFVAERAGRVTDVLIDGTGAGCGVLLILGFAWIRRKKCL